MLLENNGKASSSKRMRYISIRYYFITDRIGRHEIEVRYCPTDEMIGDFYTKPLNGSKFRKFRNIIMNCKHDAMGEVYDDTVPDHKNTPDIPNGKKNDPNTVRSYKDILVGSQECVGHNSPKGINKDGMTLVTEGMTVNGNTVHPRHKGAVHPRHKGAVHPRHKGTVHPRHMDIANPAGTSIANQFRKVRFKRLNP